jgi:hypothetical protein
MPTLSPCAPNPAGLMSDVPTVPRLPGRITCIGTYSLFERKLACYFPQCQAWMNNSELKMFARFNLAASYSDDYFGTFVL